ncbi:MAG: hypothetical protein JXP34_29270 [Planctomycetes bacterium]|nr:hypothetical protein [Planctomycetota bacterium]
MTIGLWIASIAAAVGTGGSAPEGADPTRIPGLVLWLDARDIDGDGDEGNDPAIGASIARWIDKSGNGNHATQGEPDRRPAYVRDGAAPEATAIRFRAASLQYLSVENRPSLDLTRLTALVVARVSRHSANMWLFGKNGFSPRWTGYGIAVRGESASPWPHLGLGHPGPGENGYLLCDGNIRERLALVEVACDGRRLRALLNGRLDRVQGLTGPVQANDRDLLIGASPQDPPATEPLEGEIAEVLIYDRPLDDAERQGARAYLAARHGLSLAEDRPRMVVIDNGYLPVLVENPATPETRARTPEEADAILRRDWSFQAQDAPRVPRGLQEIRWARDLAARIAGREGAPDLSEDLRELDALEERGGDLAGRDAAAEPAEAFYIAVRRLKRRIFFKSPAVDFSRVIFIDQPYPQGPEWRHQAIHRMGHRAVPGGRLLVLEGLDPGGDVRRLFPDERPGSFWRFDLSFDARRVLFCYKAHDETSFHLYEIPLDRVFQTHIHASCVDAERRRNGWRQRSSPLGGIVGGKWEEDPGQGRVSPKGPAWLRRQRQGLRRSRISRVHGTVAAAGLRRLTDGPYDDIDPIYGSDGHILFTTTRANTYVRCGPYIYSYVLARCDADGGNVYLISRNSEPDFVPALLEDGRVIYSRWEYTDKDLMRVQSLWTTNQDGTGTSVFWGNQSVWPDHLAEPRPIPGSDRVMFTGVGHHDWFSGSIGIVDPRRGSNFPHGLTKVTCDLRWAEASDPPVDRCEAHAYHASGRYTGYLGAYPISAEEFLVSARGEGDRFRLYLMDVYGNRELVYEGTYNVWYALPVKPRAVPPARPDRVLWPGTGESRGPVAPGIFYNADVHRDVPDLPRGLVKYLRVIQQDAKTYSTWKKTFRFSGPPVSVIQEEAVKRIISVVPVEADGSVQFRAPAGKALYFQLLDENLRALQTMRSFTGVMPGETRGCAGCHEMHSTSPPARLGLAFRRPPSEIAPPPWGFESIGYERFVQPVLDRRCGACHQGDGEARRVLDLTLRPGWDVFKEPYLTLVGPAIWVRGDPPAPNPAAMPKPGQPGYGIAAPIPVQTMAGHDDPRGYATIRPIQYLSFRSRLIEIAMSGEHYGVKLDPSSLRRLIAWVDANSPFLGEPEIRALGDPDFPGIDQLPIRPRLETAPRIERP